MITAKWNITSANRLRVRMEVHALTVWEVIHAPAAEVTPAIPVDSRYVNIPGKEDITRDKIGYIITTMLLMQISSSVNCAGDTTAIIKIKI